LPFSPVSAGRTFREFLKRGKDRGLGRKIARFSAGFQAFTGIFSFEFQCFTGV
jgi:hypothetical protein